MDCLLLGATRKLVTLCAHEHRQEMELLLSGTTRDEMILVARGNKEIN